LGGGRLGGGGFWGRPRPPPPTASKGTAFRIGFQSLFALLPPLYLAYLLIAQIKADWLALSDPRLDLDTLLAGAACAYLILLVATYWRKPAFKAQRSDPLAVLITLVAIDAFGLIARQPLSQPQAWPAAGTLILFGTAIAVWSVLSLGTSFSLLPQVRRLVSTGPYAYLRHPMYAGGLLITLGELWLRWTPLSIILCTIMIGAQLLRMRMEERLLEDEFPNYRRYRAQTSALIPGVY
jgi:protein-S-isoprenylcysteine O-methyltransferase Ste14